MDEVQQNQNAEKIVHTKMPLAGLESKCCPARNGACERHKVMPIAACSAL